MKHALSEASLPHGFRFAATACGLKKTGALDLGLLCSEEPASAAAVFTQNLVVAAPVLISKENLRKSKGRMRGVVLKIDRFGNLITNVTPVDAPAIFAESAKFKITVGTREITDIRKTYAEGAPGEVFGIVGSMGYLEIVANRGAAAQITGAGKGSEVSIFLGEAAAAGKGA